MQNTDACFAIAIVPTLFCFALVLINGLFLRNQLYNAEQMCLQFDR